MKKLLVIIVISVLLLSCNQTITQKDIDKLNGYWEIEKVIKQDGDKKEYKINEAIDYIEIKNNKGFRKKVYPQFDGKYLVNDLKEEISTQLNYIKEWGGRFVVAVPELKIL